MDPVTLHAAARRFPSSATPGPATRRCPTGSRRSPPSPRPRPAPAVTPCTRGRTRSTRPRFWPATAACRAWPGTCAGSTSTSTGALVAR
ncbi:hypothetical protein ACFQ0B_75920 [Nonomuraea thailandensis]